MGLAGFSHVDVHDHDEGVVSCLFAFHVIHTKSSLTSMSCIYYGFTSWGI